MKSSKSKFDYSKIQGIPEVTLRVELLRERMQYLSKGSQPRILEVGVGSGDVTLMLGRHFREITCIDSDEENCSFVMNRLKEFKLNHVEFICSKIEGAKLSKRGYNHIILQNML